jgi:hypothetical protein
MAEWEKIDVNELRDIAAQEAAQRASLEGEKISSAMRAKEKERLEIRSESRVYGLVSTDGSPITPNYTG